MFVTPRYDEVIVDIAVIISKLNDAYSMSTEIKYMPKYGVIFKANKLVRL